MRIRVFWSDPVIKIRSDPVFKIWLDPDPVFKTWSNFVKKSEIDFNVLQKVSSYVELV